MAPRHAEIILPKVISDWPSRCHSQSRGPPSSLFLASLVLSPSFLKLFSWLWRPLTSWFCSHLMGHSLRCPRKPRPFPSKGLSFGTLSPYTHFIGDLMKSQSLMLSTYWGITDLIFSSDHCSPNSRFFHPTTYVSHRHPTFYKSKGSHSLSPPQHDLLLPESLDSFLFPSH